MYCVYVIYNHKHNRYYVGCTNDLERRLKEHNHHSDAHRYTRKYDGLWEVKYTELFDNLSEARVRERYIKAQKSRQYIEKLVVEQS